MKKTKFYFQKTFIENQYNESNPVWILTKNNIQIYRFYPVPLFKEKNINSFLSEIEKIIKNERNYTVDFSTSFYRHIDKIKNVFNKADIAPSI